MSNNKVFKKLFITFGITVFIAGGLVATYLAFTNNHEIRSRADATGATLFMNPTTISDSFNKETTVNIFLTTGNYHVSAGTIYITYDSSAVSVTKITLGQYLPKVIVSPANNKGVITFTVASQPDKPVTGSGLVASLQVKPIAKENTRLSFRSDTQIAAIESLTNMLVSSAGTSITFVDAINATSTPTPTITDTPTPTVEEEVPTDTPTPTIETSTDDTTNGESSTGTDTSTTTTSYTPASSTTDQSVAPASSTFQSIVTTTNPSAQTLKMQVSFDGIDTSATPQINANVTILYNSAALGTYPVVFTHVTDTIYEGTLSLPTNIPNGPGYAIRIKGEKHLARTFCLASGQTQPCTGTDSITITDSSVSSPQTFDFTGRPLEAGDTSPQDGKADVSDLQRIVSLLSTSCSNLSDSDKMVGDLDYSGCVDVKDVYIMNKAMENPYDE